MADLHYISKYTFFNQMVYSTGSE